MTFDWEFSIGVDSVVWDITDTMKYDETLSATVCFVCFYEVKPGTILRKAIVDALRKLGYKVC